MRGALVLPLLFTCATALAQPVALEVTSRCPSAAQLSQAMRTKGSSADDAALRLRVTPREEGGVEVQLTDARGATLASRAIPAGDTCLRSAETVALLVAAWLAPPEAGPTRRPPPPAPATAPATATAAATATATATATAPATATATAPAPAPGPATATAPETIPVPPPSVRPAQPPKLALALAAGGRTLTATTWALSARLELELSPRWSAALDAGASGRTAISTGPGTLSASTRWLSAAVTFTPFVLGRGGLKLSAGPRLERLVASSTGHATDTEVGLWAPGAWLGAGWRLALSAHAFAELGVLAAARPRREVLTIEGLDAALVVPRADFSALGAIGWSFF